VKLRQYSTCVVIYGLLCLISSSWKLRDRGLSELDHHLSAGRPVIAVFWHEDFPALLPLLKGRNVCVFTSQSTRGNVIASMLIRFGYQPLQIPDRGGDRSLAIMKAALRDGHSGAIAVDGPLGPYHAVHRGAVCLAAALGFPIVPISISAANSWRIKKRWDRLALPKLFSRVRLVVGPALRIPENLSQAQMQHYQESVAKALETCARQAAIELTY